MQIVKSVNSMASHSAPSGAQHNLPAIAALAALLLGTQMLAAQSPQNPQPGAKPSAAAPSHRSKHTHAATAVTQNPAPPEPAPPAAPPTPNWPVNDSPGKPSVIWDSQGLRIDATNSSLRQILSDVATATGAKVEGLGADERIFGEYGPGQARDVLSQLLNGSGYNVLMIGDQGQGTPRQIVLSARHTVAGPNNAASAPQPNADAQDDDPVEQQPEADDQPVVPPPPPNRMPMGQPGVPRTPQQVMEELQQRQQQLQNQQQQQIQQQQPPH